MSLEIMVTEGSCFGALPNLLSIAVKNTFLHVDDFEKQPPIYKRRNSELLSNRDAASQNYIQSVLTKRGFVDDLMKKLPPMIERPALQRESSDTESDYTHTTGTESMYTRVQEPWRLHSRSSSKESLGPKDENSYTGMNLKNEKGELAMGPSPSLTESESSTSGHLTLAIDSESTISKSTRDTHSYTGSNSRFKLRNSRYRIPDDGNVSAQTKLAESQNVQPDCHPDWSVGSAGHEAGTCKPCVWFWRPSSCKKGRSCQYCHLCDEGAMKRSKQENREAEIHTDVVLPVPVQPSAPQEKPWNDLVGTLPQGITSAGNQFLMEYYRRSRGIAPPAQGPPRTLKLTDIVSGGARDNWILPSNDDAGTEEYEQPTELSGASFGSNGHSEGNCRPCAWFWKPGSCNKGVACDYCHLCDEVKLLQAIQRRKDFRNKEKLLKSKSRKRSLKS